MHVEPPVHPVVSHIPALSLMARKKARRQRTRARLVNLLIPHHTPDLVNQFCGILLLWCPDSLVLIDWQAVIA